LIPVGGLLVSGGIIYPVVSVTITWLIPLLVQRLIVHKQRYQPRDSNSDYWVDDIPGD
jgi:hypothetical protein